MKICQILAGNEEGGLEKHTIELTKMLQLKNIDVTVVAHQKFGDELKGVRFVPMDLTKSRRNPLILYQLGRFLHKENFDIIHTQANKATDMVAKLRPFFDARMIATLHSQKHRLRGFEKADCVITVSDKIGEKLQTHCKTTIYNGLTFPYSLKELQSDIRNRYSISKERFLVCTVARLTKVKRIDLMIEALWRFKEAHLIIVGDGDEKKKLEILAKNLNVEDRITFTGALYAKEAYKIIYNSDVFLMTSDYEGFPYTFIESMYCRTPFISTQVSDISKFITDYYTVPFDDAEAVAKKIAEVKRKYDQVLKTFEPLFSKARRDFTLEHMTEKTVGLYQKVLNANPRH